MTGNARDELFAKLAARRGLGGAAVVVPRRDPHAEVPLLPAQRQLWFLDRLGVRDGVYAVSAAWRLTGTVDQDVLRRSVNLLVSRHEALRFGFAERDGGPRQFSAPAGIAVPMSTVDLRGGVDPDVSGVLAAEFDRPFDLGRPPLVRSLLIRVAEDQWVFSLCLHHIVCDGPSLSIMVAEFGECYRALLANEQPDLPEPAVRYGDYAVWLDRQTETAEAHGAYWRAQLADAPALLELPTDRPRPAVQSFRGGRALFHLPREQARAVTELCQHEGVTTFAALLAAFTVLLARYSRQDDIVVGAPMRDESVPGLERGVGMFVNTVAVRTRLDGDPTVRELLAQVRQRCLEALEHQRYPWEQVARALQPDRSLSHNPVFQAMFVLNGAGDGLVLPGVDVQALTPPATTSHFDLTLALAHTEDGISGQFDFATDLFEPGTVERMARHFERVLHAMAADPGVRVSEMDLLTAAERLQVRAGGHRAGIAGSRPGRLVTELIAERAAAAPQAIAVADGPDELSYGELVCCANLLAWELHQRGIGPETVVGLGLPHGSAAVVGLLGILNAGGAYVPLDPSHPADRLAALLDEVRPPVLVTDREHAAAFGEYSGEIVIVDLDAVAVDAGPPPVAVHPDNLAYVIYTSGSTGVPNGVMVSHGTLTNLALNFRAEHGFDADQRVLVMPPLTFDAAVGDLFPALIGGSTLLFCADPAALSGRDLVRLCAEQRITMVDTASALWQKWVEDLDSVPADSPLRTMMVGGESVPLDSLRRWAQLTDGRVSLYNHYGPTEATVCATTYRTVDGSELAGGSQLPIGRPLPHVRVYLVDEQLRATPPGVPGEVCLGGAALARGYLGRSGLTAGRFVPDPFDPAPGARMYRTGDLAKWSVSGQLEFLGRVDRQVKIRGHRIEPAEVEAACRRQPGVRDVVVVAREDVPGDKRLVAYLVAEQVLDPAELRVALRGTLPDHLVPDAFVVLDALPLTRHGKVDHRVLPVPAASNDAVSYVEPSTTVGRRLAGLWAEVLGCERVGAHDSFFSLGGHSLLAATLVTKVRARFGVELPLRSMFETNTLAEFAELVEARLAGVLPVAASGSAPAVDQLDLWAEARLPSDVRLPGGVGDLADALGRAAAPRIALLTGSTGPLGGYLLADLLRNTDASVRCLVRAEDSVAGLERIERSLRAYQLWREGDAQRIVAIPGDLGAPRFGLSESEFDALAADVDVIYHSASAVNFALSYADLKPTNVDGTVEVLRLACRQRITPVHLLSTLSVYPMEVAGVVSESRPPDTLEGLDTGYEKSKWVADALGRAARAVGLPVAIYRLARVTGDSRTGIGPADDLFGRVLRAMVLVGAVPVVDKENMVPVDYVAEAIGRLSRQSSSYGRDFHFYNAWDLEAGDLADALSEFGYPVRALPHGQWYAELVRRAADSGDPLLTSAAALVDPLPPPEIPDFDCTATESAVAATGLHCPPAGAALLQRYLSHFVESGYLPAPVLEVNR